MRRPASRIILPFTTTFDRTCENEDRKHYYLMRQRHGRVQQKKSTKTGTKETPPPNLLNAGQQRGQKTEEKEESRKYVRTESRQRGQKIPLAIIMIIKQTNQNLPHMMIGLFLYRNNFCCRTIFTRPKIHSPKDK